jgi:hypothetical protein
MADFRASFEMQCANLTFHFPVLPSSKMQNDKVTIGQVIGLGVLILTINMPAMASAGFPALFGLELNWDLPICIAVATLGGAVGGALLANKHFIAGFIGGLLAGPSGFFAVYYYCLHSDTVSNYEGVLVQLVGSLPGIGVFYLLKRTPSAECPAEAALEETEDKRFDQSARETQVIESF